MGLNRVGLGSEYGNSNDLGLALRPGSDWKFGSKGGLGIAIDIYPFLLKVIKNTTGFAMLIRLTLCDDLCAFQTDSNP